MRCEQARRLRDRATNGEIATNNEATNAATNKEVPSEVRQPGSDLRARIGVDGASKLQATGGSGGAAKTANRRSREAYNAYQREYMKKRRAHP